MFPPCFYLFLDHSRIHVGNLSNGELSSNLCRDDSLCTGVREGPLNAMDGDSGVAPHVGQQVHLKCRKQGHSFISLCPARPKVDYSDHGYDHLVAVHELVDTDLGLVVFNIKLDVLVHFPFLIRKGRHSLPDPRNQDLTTGADQCVYGKKKKRF